MKKLLSLLLCAAMLFCLLPLEARAASGAWDGTVDISWYDPEKAEYEIDTPAKLAGLAALVLGIAAAWFGANLFQVAVGCCAVVLVLEFFLL